MRRARRIIVSVLATAALGAGCQSSPWSAGSSMPQQPAQPAPAASPGPATRHGTPGTPRPSGAEMPDPTALQQVMGELQQLGALDPAGQEKLLADLQQTDPVLWPLVLQQFRAAVAYRRQAAQRELAGAGPLPPQTAAQAASSGAGAPGSAAASTASGYPPQLAAARPHIAGTAPAGVAIPSAASSPAGTDSPSGPAPPGRPGPATTPPPPAIPSARPAGSPPTPRGPSSAPPAPPAGTRPSAAPSPSDWHAQVASAAESLKANLPGSPQSPEEITKHAQLRMLYLLAGRRNEALLPIPSLAPALQQFWLKELYGLATWLDTARNPDAARRAAEAKQVLGEALGRLGETAPLVVRNLAFCTEVQSYGCLKKFPKYEFTPGQEVLLYAEVENYASEETAEGFHTSMQSSYRIFDSRGQQVVERDFPVTEEHCQNPRRDFFIGYHLRLPKRIYNGRHTLKLTIEDLKSQKVGESSIEFRVVDAQE